MAVRQDLTGRTFGKLTVMSRAPNLGVKTAWNCICECGNSTVVRTGCLNKGGTRSCGCEQYSGLDATKHGLSSHLLHTVWRGIKNRCDNETHDSYEIYGARGITMCGEWRADFLLFYNWCMDNGWTKGLHIDRLSGDGNYEPSNCRVVTPQQNTFNRGASSKKTSAFKGVHKSGKYWVASVTKNKTRIYEEKFGSEKEAAIAYNTEAAKAFGKYAFLNEIGE